MPLPSYTPQQSGVDPLSVQKQQDQTQKIAEILSKIETRLGNVTNMRSNVQMAAYDVFGNNFITRGLTQITDAIGESIESLFKEPEKEKEDPILTQLKRNNDILLSIEKNTHPDLIEGEIINLRHDIKHNRELEKLESTTQLDALQEIRRTLETLGKPRSKSKKSDPVDATPEQASIPPTTLKLENDAIIDVEARVVPDNKADDSKKPSKAPKGPNLSKTNHILSQMLSALVSINTNIAKLLQNNKVSTQEDDLESVMMRRNRADDVKSKPQQSSKPSFFDKLFDLDANILGFKNIMRSLTKVFARILSAASPLLRIFPMLAGAITSVLSLLKKIPFGQISKSLAKGAGKLIQTGTEVAKKGAGKLIQTGTEVAKKGAGKLIPKSGAMKMPTGLGVVKGLGAAAIVTGAAMGVDYAAGKLGVGGKEINEAQDDANWNRATTMEKVQSAIPRGIEKVGSFLGFDNLANQARSDRIASETKYLDDKLAQIEKASPESGSKSKTPQASNVVINNQNTSSQTIMPTRTVVKNQDPSYNRYLDSVLKR